MAHQLLGWPEASPRLRLDHRRFAYAGKFVTGDTGKAVTTAVGADPPEPDESEASGGTAEPPTEPPARSFTAPSDPVLAAVAFSPDRTEPATLWLRYVTVRRDRQGEGIGGRLCAFVCDRAATRAFDTVQIAVNNPFAYDAAVKAGFAYTGRETGVAELVLARPASRPATVDASRYRTGLEAFRARDLPAADESFLQRAIERGPPG